MDFFEEKISKINMIKIIKDNVQLLYFLYQAIKGAYKNTENEKYKQLDVLENIVDVEPYGHIINAYKIIEIDDDEFNYEELYQLTAASLKFQNYIQVSLGDFVYTLSKEAYYSCENMANVILKYDDYVDDFITEFNLLLDKAYVDSDDEVSLFDMVEISSFYSTESFLCADYFLKYAPKLIEYKEELCEIISDFKRHFQDYDNACDDFINTSKFYNIPYPADVYGELYGNLYDFVETDLCNMFDFRATDRKWRIHNERIFSLKLEEFVENLRSIVKNKVITKKLSKYEKII